MHKCKNCSQGLPRYAPELRQSGHAAPKDLICPICGAFHDGKSGQLSDDKEAVYEHRQRIMRARNMRSQYYTPKHYKPK